MAILTNHFLKRKIYEDQQQILFLVIVETTTLLFLLFLFRIQLRFRNSPLDLQQSISVRFHFNSNRNCEKCYRRQKINHCCFVLLLLLLLTNNIIVVITAAVVVVWWSEVNSELDLMIIIRRWQLHYPITAYQEAKNQSTKSWNHANRAAAAEATNICYYSWLASRQAGRLAGSKTPLAGWLMGLEARLGMRRCIQCDL